MSRAFQTRTTLTREELYERVWTTPVYKLGEEFALSGRGLGKLCKRLRIPTPPRGYWAKKAHGKEVSRCELPELADDEKKLETVDLSLPPPEPPLTEDEVEKVQRECQDDSVIIVPNRLNEPHPLVLATQEELASSEPGAYGRVFAPGYGTLNVAVGPDSIGRALRIMDALLKALEERDLKVAVRRDRREGKYTVVEVGDEAVKFELTERSRREERELSKSGEDRWRRRLRESLGDKTTVPEFFPTGRLVLQILSPSFSYDTRRTWADGKRQRVEDCLNDFIISVIRIGAERREQTRRHLAKENRLQEKQAARQAVERASEEKAERLRELEEDAEAWHRSQRISTYLDALEAAAGSEDIDTGEAAAFTKWLAWARGEAERLDPLASGRALRPYEPSMNDGNGQED